MDQVTQQNAALVEEAAAAASSMSEQAEGLSRAVASFRLDEARPGFAKNAVERRSPNRAANVQRLHAAMPQGKLLASRAASPSASPAPAKQGTTDGWAEF
jgi:hypothetical protein